jgi:cytochrome c556
MTSKFKMLIAAALLSAGTIAAYAATADETVKLRQDCMKTQGAFMGVAVPMIKGEKPYDRAALDAAWTVMDGPCSKWSSFWDPASKMGGETIKSYAKPEIWTDTAGFEKVSMNAYNAMTALRATKDEAGFKAAFGAVGAGCKGCHEGFRAPKS